MFKQLSVSLLGVLAAIVVILGFAKLLGPLPLSISQTVTNKQNTFDVTGDGEVTTAPDRAKISAGVQVNDSTVAAVQDKGNKIITQVTADLVKLGVDKADIKTSGYSLYPNYDYRSNPQKIIGYNLNISLLITIKDFNKINDVIDTATRDGANQVGGVSFTLSDDKRRQIEDQVRELAIQRAKEKATSLSRIAGIRLGKIINVVESSNQVPRALTMYAKETMMPVPTNDAAGGATPTQVSPGSTTFSMSVTLSYETL